MQGLARDPIQNPRPRIEVEPVFVVLAAKKCSAQIGALVGQIAGGRVSDEAGLRCQLQRAVYQLVAILIAEVAKGNASRQGGVVGDPGVHRPEQVGARTVSPLSRERPTDVRLGRPEIVPLRSDRCAAVEVVAGRDDVGVTDECPGDRVSTDAFVDRTFIAVALNRGHPEAAVDLGSHPPPVVPVVAAPVVALIGVFQGSAEAVVNCRDPRIAPLLAGYAVLLPVREVAVLKPDFRRARCWNADTGRQVGEAGAGGRDTGQHQGAVRARHLPGRVLQVVGSDRGGAVAVAHIDSAQESRIHVVPDLKVLGRVVGGPSLGYEVHRIGRVHVDNPLAVQAAGVRDGIGIARLIEVREVRLLTLFQVGEVDEVPMGVDDAIHTPSDGDEVGTLAGIAQRCVSAIGCCAWSSLGARVSVHQRPLLRVLRSPEVVMGSILGHHLPPLVSLVRDSCAEVDERRAVPFDV